ncbi:diacylglycerol kinase family protein [Daejeonella sp. H1SJ63]|jgi:YegS/Rv2252/BmrU family lipid kinase|uniref:diacylglycerol/lipid kinase family protein n=1 Tax=Daejeonella sp. H1SJ63 TaxID=3034145 RepID=UPI0023EE1489|nr:diacylglycerol kinase family protein [Daejeonella sp. H1SJ63]
MHKAAEPAGRPLRLLFIINPRSGRGSEKVISGLISEYAKKHSWDFRIYSMSENDENAIKAEIDTFLPDRIAAAGGDGTISLMATILNGSSIPLSIIPTGSANGMAKELNIPSRIEAALETCNRGNTKTIDLMRINDKTCIHLADVGLNARVVKRFEKDPKRGLLTYARHLFGEMFLLKTYTFRIVIDGVKIKRKGVSITFANASKYGTGAVINPEGKLDDGKFELVIIKPFPGIKLLSIAWKMFVNRLHTSDYVEIISCRNAQVFSNKKTTLQIDGEVFGKVKEIGIKSIPRALTVIIP